MYQMSLKWFGLMLLMSSAVIFAASAEEDAGPMPPPDGPFFSSKPLLYFGEEPSVIEINGLAIQNIPAASQRPPMGAGYPLPQEVPGYYGRTAPTPLGMGRNMMQRPMPVYPSGWGAQYPYNRYNPNYPGYPPYPGRWGVNPR